MWGRDNGQFKGPPAPDLKMEKPNNIINLNPMLNAARQKDFEKKFVEKLKSENKRPANTQKAIDETRNAHVDGGLD